MTPNSTFLMNEFRRDLAASQVPMDAEAVKAVYANIWDLYEDEAVTDTTERDIRVAKVLPRGAMHLMRLMARDAGANGWTSCSPRIAKLIESELPLLAELNEDKSGAQLTAEGRDVYRVHTEWTLPK